HRDCNTYLAGRYLPPLARAWRIALVAFSRRSPVLLGSFRSSHCLGPAFEGTESTLKPLVKEIACRQNPGENMRYSMHIYSAVRWRLNFGPDVETSRRRITDLRESLDDREQQKDGGPTAT